MDILGCLLDVTKSFHGREEQSLTCTLCGHQNVSTMDFNELKIGVYSTKSTVQESIQAYLAPEELDDECACAHCGQRSRLVKTMSLVELPSILILHLLRYKFDRESNSKKKLLNELDYSEKLMLHDEEYTLCSVIFHLGTSAHGGHYVCDCREWKSNRWFHLDDEATSELLEILQPQQPQKTSPAVVDLSLDTTDKQASMRVDPANRPQPKKRSRLVMGRDYDSDNSDNNGDADNSSVEVEKELNRQSKHTNSNKRRVKNRVDELSAESPPTSMLNRKKDCYLLFYVKTSAIKDSLGRVSVDCNSDLDTIVAENDEYRSVVSRVTSARNHWEKIIRARKEVYEMVQTQLLPKSPLDPFVLVDALNLRRWIVGEAISFQTPPIIPRAVEDYCIAEDGVAVVEDGTHAKPNLKTKDCVDVLCPHGYIVPQAIGKFKVLSPTGSEILMNAGAGCDGKCESSIDELDQPQFSTNPKFLSPQATNETLICEICWTSRVSNSQQIADEYETLSPLLEKIQTCAEKFNHQGKKFSSVTVDKSVSNDYWLSKKFFQDLKKYNNKLSSELSKWDNEKTTFLKAQSLKEADLDSLRAHTFSTFPLNSNVLCAAHQQLSIGIDEQGFPISSRMMEQLQLLFPEMIVVEVRSSTCSDCRQSLDSKKFSQQELEASRLLQREDPILMELMRRKTGIPESILTNDFISSQQLDETTIFHVVDANWLHKWRLFLRHTLTTKSSGIDSPLNERLCCLHGKLFCLDILDLACGDTQRRLKQTSELDLFPTIEIVTTSEWNRLLELYPCPDSDVRFQPTVVKTATGCHYEPGLCADCIEEQTKSFFHNQTLFNNRLLTVVYFGTEEQMRDYMFKRDSGQKTNLRSRGSSLQKFSVESSHDDTLGFFKLKVYENCTSIDLAPGRQRVFTDCGVELKNNNKLLSEMNINADNMLFVVKTISDEGQNWVDGFFECNQRSTDEGFKGGLLSDRLLDTSTSKKVTTSPSTTSTKNVQYECINLLDDDDDN
jgi:hypothetical protein